MSSLTLIKLFSLSAARSSGVDDYDLGAIPFVTSAEQNNGVVSYVEPDVDDKVFAGPAIAISGLGHATVQVSIFLPKGNGGDSLTVLEPRSLTIERRMQELRKHLAEFDEYPDETSDGGEKKSVKQQELETELAQQEAEYAVLPYRDWEVADLVAVAAAFNILHKWRFSYGRKCSVERLKDLAVPFPFRNIAEVWDSESQWASETIGAIKNKVGQRIVHTS